MTLLVPLAGPSSSAVAAPSPNPATCGVRGPAHYQHVVWIVLENVGYSVVNSPSAPYLNSLARACGLATNYDSVTHPSLPNYIALTSGSPQGITDDNDPASHHLSVPSIFSQLGSNWTSLVESMPTSCDQVSSGQYAAKHNPAAYYVNLGSACRRQDVALKYPLNLQRAFTLIVPNVCNDMHSCPVATGDAWLRRVVPMITRSPLYRARSLALFITFDENTSASSNQVPTYVVAPSVGRGQRVSAPLNSYSLLLTTEQLLHRPALAGARGARSMVALFHL